MPDKGKNDNFGGVSVNPRHNCVLKKTETKIVKGVVQIMKTTKRFLIAVTAVILMAFAVPAFAASNPFMDVPANHWAYDAISQLASRGVISGYPDGSYKGGQPATRYEMASAVARALAKIDFEKASKQDLELLKKLVLELKDELDALGVKVDKIDGRLKVMEKDLGGWSMAGQLRFDAKFGAEENNSPSWYADDGKISGKNEFDLNRYRLWIKKRIDENTTFTARLGSSGNNDSGRTVVWDRYYVTTKLPYDIKFTIGRQSFDWEGDLGLYHPEANDAWVGDLTKNMLMFEKDWGMANLKLVIARDNDSGWADATKFDANKNRTWENVESFLVAGLADFNFSEKFSGGLMAYYQFADDEVFVNNVETDSDLGTYGVYLKYAFTPAIEFKGVYYHQAQGDSWARKMTDGTTSYDDVAKAWKVMVDVKQEALKFTSLWLEYGQMDNNFYCKNMPYANYGADVLYNQKKLHNLNTSKIYGAVAEQKWNDKWSTFLRYYQVDADTAGIDDAVNWGGGVAYQYSAAIKFELAYDKIDYGTNSATAPTGLRNGDDNVIRFRTFVTF